MSQSAARYSPETSLQGQVNEGLDKMMAGLAQRRDRHGAQSAQGHQPETYLGQACVRDRQWQNRIETEIIDGASSWAEDIRCH